MSAETAAHEANHAHWTSNLGFLFATMGAAIGLGSVWRFPYAVGTGGGGAFVLVYLATSLAITVPILIAELMLGRRGQANPATTMRRLAEEVGASPRWAWMGAASIVTVFVIGTYYSVIGGWVLAYLAKSATGNFTGASPTEVVTIYRDFLADPLAMALWHALFMASTVAVLAGGISGGIERASRIMMPALFAMLLALIVYAVWVGDWQRGLSFLFRPDFAALDARHVLGAVSLSFFSIGTGMAIMMTYGSYLTHRMSVVASAMKVAASVPVCALMMGMAIFPLVFANGLDPAEGPGLVLVTLPTAFGQMLGGTFFGALFFLLASFAALTSAIAGLEPAVAWLEERGLSRTAAVVFTGVVGWAFGLATVFSFNLWADWHPLGFIDLFAGMTLFEVIDFVTSNVMLPLINILICVFVGWFVPRALLVEELGGGHPRMMAVWRIILRYFAPIPIALILGMGLFA